jgi:hypothetical protein
MENAKPKRNIKKILLRTALAVIILVLLGLGFIYWYDSAGQKADKDFDASVKSPAYTSYHPQILFDAAHNNYHTSGGRYKPLADLLKSDGFTITENKNPVTAASFDSIKVFIIANAMGPGEHEGHPAFTKEEDSSIVQWVRNGGNLLLVADHAPFGSAAEELSKCFGVEMFLTYARDDKNSDSWDNEKLIFSPENGLLTKCSITEGRNASEKVCKVETFTGQSLSIPPAAIPVLKMSDESYDWESSKIRSSAKGHAQCIALNFGKGRVIVLGEAGVLSAQVDPLGFKMGMNYPGTCDKQFALNIFHWLSGVLN